MPCLTAARSSLWLNKAVLQGGKPPLTPKTGAERAQKIRAFCVGKGGKMPTSQQPPKGKKPSSEKRERGLIIGVRVNPEEKSIIEDAAGIAGLSLASYIRGLVLEAPQTKKTRKPSLDRVALAQVLAQVGKIGSNLNQIARRLNQGKGVGLERLGAALDEVAAIKTAILEALKGVK